MKIAFYTGSRRLFNKLVCWKMRGPYSHVEAVIEDGGNGLALCASASFSDGGVRFKQIDLRSGNWDVIDVPSIDAARVAQWFAWHEHEPYDVRGLVNFILPVGHNPEGWFCDEALLDAMGMREAWRFDPNSMARVCELLGGKWQYRQPIKPPPIEPPTGGFFMGQLV